MPVPRPFARLVLAVIVGCAAASDAAAATEQTGITPGGSAYRIVTPDGWQPGDGLVLVQHSYRFTPVVAPGPGPSAEVMLADGFAIAAPGYRQPGWSVFDAVRDNIELLQLFREQLGDPGPVIVHGESMGALIGLKLAESAALRDQIDGVLALCPAADGVGVWDQAFHLRIVYDALCADVPNGQLPAGDAPFPWASNLDVLERAPQDPLQWAAAMRAEPAVQACLGLHLPPNHRDAGMSARLRTLLASRQPDVADEDVLAARLAQSFFGLSDLVRGAGKLDGANPFGNRELMDINIDGTGPFFFDLGYGQRDASDPLLAALDDTVLRVRADPFARLQLTQASVPQGSLQARVLAVHTNRDPLVPALNLSFLESRLSGAEIATVAVAETGATHCGFTQAEYDSAWDSLRAWSQRQGHEPDPFRLRDACRARGAADQCRHDSAATATAARQPYPGPALKTPTLSPLQYGGLWIDPQRPAQGLLIEQLGDQVLHWRAGEQRVAISWYTWAPAADPEPGPRWLYGVGRVWFDSIQVDDMFEVRGGRFGSALDPALVGNVRWGSLRIVAPVRELDDSNVRLTLRYAGPQAWGQGEVDIYQLTRAGNPYLDPNISISPEPLQFNYSRAGTYFDPQHPAGGWVLSHRRQLSSSNPADQPSLLLWFTWDPDGRPTWLFGQQDGLSDPLRFPMQQARSGGRFEPGYTLEDIEFVDWGEVSLGGHPCADRRITSVQWTSTQPGYPAEIVAVDRLTAPNLNSVEYECGQ